MPVIKNAVELGSETPSVVIEEDCIPLLINGEDIIFFIRNYNVDQCVIFISNSIYNKLSEEERPMTHVFLRPNFRAIRQFKNEIRQFILETGRLNNFYHFFNCSMAEFFNSL